MKAKRFLLIAAVALFALTSCEKNSPLEQKSLDIADDDAVVEAVYEDIYNSVDIAVGLFDLVMNEPGLKSSSTVLADSCPLVTIDFPDAERWPKVITIDYGAGCSGFYGATRAGKIIIEITGPRRVIGSKRTVTFENYFINGIGVEGTRTVENMGPNNNGNVVFKIVLENGKLVLPDGKELLRESVREREFIAGFATNNPWDDECLITGFVNGTNYEGLRYQNTIITALHWKRVCAFFVSGIVEIKVSGVEPFTLDYGDGECDAVATVSRGDQSREITLRFRHRKMIVR